MSQQVTVEVSDQLLKRAQAVAQRTQRRPEEVLSTWLDQAQHPAPLESLADSELLTICDEELAPNQQDELSELLVRQRELSITASQRVRLDELLAIYRRGLVRKAEALRLAVARGLRPPLT